MYLDHYWPPAEHGPRVTEENDFKKWIFKESLRIGHTRLLCKFEGQIYEQLRGLAMGVAGSPDIANLFGVFFEQQAHILDHPAITFYGRYIDDCLAVVYASNEQEAVGLLQDRIKFDGCTIEWVVSDQYMVFLDMMLFKDENNCLQYKPYRKDRNHLERVPWISHHPLDVKRGTFLGEMSRLAVLSSKRHYYVDAIKGLVALYVTRGYPKELVLHWSKENVSTRWDKRLTNNSAQVAREDVLVLKTEFNAAWNWFNASEFSEQLIGYWREWLNRFHAGGPYNLEYPPPQEDEHKGLEVGNHTLLSRDPRSNDQDPSWVFDLSKIGMLDKRILVSRKRTRNLFDLTNLWKKIVFTTLDEQIGQEQGNQHLAEVVHDDLALVNVPAHALYREDSPVDDIDIIEPHRRSPPAPRMWQYGHW
jgi:hypothetical protein